MRALRVALLGGEADVRAELAAGLAEHGHDATGHDLVLGPALGAADRLLRARGFTGALPQVALAAHVLRGADYDVAHALSPAAARGALAWRRGSGRPVVFTCSEVLDRPTLSDRRLRLDLLASALERSDAVTATTEEGAAALRRWMAVDAPVLAAGDGAAHGALYARLLAG